MGRDRHYAHIKATDATPVRFFVADPLIGAVFRTPEGFVRVYTNRSQADAEARREFRCSPFLVIGMGEEKWKRFQREMPFVEIADDPGTYERVPELENTDDIRTR